MSFFSIRSILHPYVDVLQGDLCEEGLKKKKKHDRASKIV